MNKVADEYASEGMHEGEINYVFRNAWGSDGSAARLS